MKKMIGTLLLMAMPMLALAQSQQLKFGYVSYEQALKAMMQYEVVQQNLADLKAKYDEELKRAADEFNRKYEEFLDGQKNFAPIIREKRHSELLDMMQKNLAFKAEATRLLEQARKEAMAPLNIKLKSVLAEVAAQMGLAFILNTDNNALPYVDPLVGVDVSHAVYDKIVK